MWQLSRRAVLKAIASAGIASAAPLSFGCGDDETILTARAVEQKALHFTLSGLRPNLDHVLELGGLRYPLVAHDDDSRAKSRASNVLLAQLEDHELTHYVADAIFPADAPQSYTVTHELDDGRRRIALAGLHVPRSGIVAARAIKTTSFTFLAHRRQTLGLRGISDIDPTLTETDLTLLTDLSDAARWLVYHHPDILSLDPTVAVILLSHVDGLIRLDESDSFSKLVNQMKDIGYATDDPDADGWARAEFTLDPNDQLVPSTDENGVQLKDRNGRPAWQFHFEPHPDLTPFIQNLVVDLLNAARNDEHLEGARFFTPVARSDRGEPLAELTPTIPVTSAGGVDPAPPIDVTTPPNLAGAGGYTWSQQREGSEGGQLITFTADGGSSRTLNVSVENGYNRHLGVFFAYLDATGKPMLRQDAWKSAGEDSTSTKYLRYAGMLDAPPSLLGIPLGIKQKQTFRVWVPPEVSRLAVLTGTFAFHDGEYRSEYKGVYEGATLATLAIEYGIPTLALAWGAKFTAGGWKTVVTQLGIIVAKLVVKVAIAIPDPKEQPRKSFDYTKMGIWLGGEVLKLGLSTSASFAAVWAGAVTLGNVTRGIPVLGTALYAVQVASTAATLTRTTVEASMSKLCSEFQITSTNPVRFVVAAKKYGFPQTGKSYRVLLTPLLADTLAPTVGAFDPVATPSSFAIDVPVVPSGGTVRYVVEILAASGAVVGRSVGEFVNVLPDGAQTLERPIQITNSKIVIDKDTKYSPLKRLEIVNGRHKWVPDATTPLPGADLACTPEAICEAVTLTVGGEAQIAYGWKEAERSTGLCDKPSQTRGTVVFTMQNLNLNVTADFAAGDPDATLKNVGCGEFAPILPVYRVSGDNETPYLPGAVPDSLVLEASSGVYHLRTYRPTPTSSADHRAGASWGKLQSPALRGAALHKCGTLMAISGIGDKLEVLSLPVERGPGKDIDAPQSALRSGPGGRVGYLSRPVAICASEDTDSFVVLEDGNKRMQAFGAFSGAPDVTFFNKNGARDAIFELDRSREYLDIAYEAGNKLLYVLSRIPGSAQPNDFVLDIYRRQSGLLATTRAFVARKIALDDNQNVYALGWSTLLLGGRREPDVWAWIPTVKA